MLREGQNQAICVLVGLHPMVSEGWEHIPLPLLPTWACSCSGGKEVGKGGPLLTLGDDGHWNKYLRDGIGMGLSA